MSKIISQNDLDAKQISDSVKNFFDRFHVSQLLKASNIKDENDIDHRCNGYRRRKLALSKGTEAMIELIRESRKALFPADYVLFDSWFASPKTLTAVKALGYDVIAMIKRTDKMTFNCDGSKLSLKEIYRMNKKRRGRSKYQDLLKTLANRSVLQGVQELS